jgi:hypothetical protein
LFVFTQMTQRLWIHLPVFIPDEFAESFDVLNDGLHVTVSGPSIVQPNRRVRFHCLCVRFSISSFHNVGQMTGMWTEVEHRYADCQDVIDLAWMHNPNHGISYDDNMQISGRKRSGQFVQGLIWQAKDMGNGIFLAAIDISNWEPLLNLPPFTAATTKQDPIPGSF